MHETTLKLNKWGFFCPECKQLQTFIECSEGLARARARYRLNADSPFHKIADGFFEKAEAELHIKGGNQDA